MFLAVPPDAQLQPIRQGVHDRHANTVQAARHLIAVLVELPARVQLGHDNLGRRDALFFVNSDRNSASVVAHRYTRIRVNFDRNFGGMTGQCLVDAVVHDLIDHVMQTRPVVGIADIHAGTLANRLQSLENLDGIRAIFLRLGGLV